MDTPPQASEFLLGKIHANVETIMANQTRLEEKVDKSHKDHEVRIVAVERQVWKISAIAGVCGAFLLSSFKYISERVWG